MVRVAGPKYSPTLDRGIKTALRSDGGKESQQVAKTLRRHLISQAR